MAKDLKLKAGWLARDIAAASEQVKRLKTPIYTSDRVFDGVRVMTAEAADPHVERLKKILNERGNTDITRAIADLRHAYGHMINGRVNDVEALARGLIGPAIERLERATLSKDTTDGSRNK